MIQQINSWLASYEVHGFFDLQYMHKVFSIDWALRLQFTIASIVSVTALMAIG